MEALPRGQDKSSIDDIAVKRQHVDRTVEAVPIVCYVEAAEVTITFGGVTRTCNTK